MLTSITLALLIATQAPTSSPSSSSSPIPVMRAQHKAIADILLKAIALVPDADLGFKPTPRVRSMADVFMHTAQIQYVGCPFISGDKPTPPKFFAKYSAAKGDFAAAGGTKADLVGAMTESFQYCDGILASLTDQQANQTIKAPFLASLLGLKEGPAYTYELYTLTHMWEHYGNLVTYMRLRGLVPPTSPK